MTTDITGGGRFAPGLVPAELQTRKQWVGFKIISNGGGKPNKIPVIATAPKRHAKSNDSSTWSTLEAAIAGAKAGAYSAIAYALSDDYVGIDLDGERWVCGDSELTEEAQAIVERCGTYAEISIGGQGVHILLRGKLARGRCDHDIGTEIYSDRRFLIVTGRRIADAPVTINENQAAVDWFLNRYFPDDAPTERTEMASVISGASVISVDSVLSVDEVIALTLPHRQGQRNDCILKLARGLKFDARLADKPLASLKPIVRKWHRQALPFIGTQPFDDTWADFIRAFAGARFPLRWKGDAWALAKARSEPLPSIAADYDSENVRLLVGTCWHLASLAKDRRFFLSCHQAGKLFGVSHEKAMRWLQMLIDDGVLALLESGNQHRANRYTFIAPEPRKEST